MLRKGNSLIHTHTIYIKVLVMLLMVMKNLRLMCNYTLKNQQFVPITEREKTFFSCFSDEHKNGTLHSYHFNIFT